MNKKARTGRTGQSRKAEREKERRERERERKIKVRQTLAAAVVDGRVAKSHLFIIVCQPLLSFFLSLWSRGEKINLAIFPVEFCDDATPRAR